jgi:hypothetical protein
MIALTLLFMLLTHPGGPASKEDQRRLFSLSSLAGVFSALAGVLLVTSEYRYGTIRPTILFNPERSHVLAAKAIAGALAGIAFGVLGEAIGWAILDGRGITAVLSSGDILLLTLGGLAGAAVWGRDRRRARSDHPQPSRRLHHPVRLVLVVDTSSSDSSLRSGGSRQTRASDALMGLRVHHLISPGAGAITLIAWAGALGMLGIALSVRQDIN